MSGLADYDLPPPELVIELNPPVTHGGMTLSSITLREPLGSEVRAAEGHLRKGVDVESLRSYNFSLISKVSGVSMAILETLPISRLELAAEYLGRFARPSRLTGES